MMSQSWRRLCGSRPVVGSSRNRIFGIADQRGGDGQALALSAGKFAHPGVGFFGELQFFQDLVRRARLAIEAGEQLDRLAHGELFREARFLQRNAEPLAQLAGVRLPRSGRGW